MNKFGILVDNNGYNNPQNKEEQETIEYLKEYIQKNQVCITSFCLFVFYLCLIIF